MNRPRYTVELKPSADRALERLPKSLQQRIVGQLTDLQSNPRPTGAVKLAGDENLWRVRVGNYRIVYEIHANRLVVLVLRIAHRKDVYRG